MSGPTGQMRNNEFLLELERRFTSMQQYEDKRLQQKALSQLPLLKFEEKAQERMRALQKQVKKGTIEDVNISIQEFLLLELLDWFKMTFEWVDNPDCDHCGNGTKFSHMSNDPKLLENCSRVEMHRCHTCSKFTPFFRYTNLDILLVTREGRCGEWASVFTLFCRAMGWDTRYVYDQTDHVWTEVYSIAQNRWLHCDPCENSCDNPLMYEIGWGKKLSYIFAFSHEEIQDVTWRYTSDHKKILENRKFCTELELVETILKLREEKQRKLSEARRNYLNKRLIAELVELMIEKKPTDSEKQGRTSGSLTWRSQRGETGENPSEKYTWVASESELSLGQMDIRYSPTKDQYERLKNTQNGTVITGKLEKWENGVYLSHGLFKKDEKDWKMTYICRREGVNEGEIQWRFESGSPNKVIDNVTVIFDSNTFENGQINVQLCGDEKCILLPTNETRLSSNDLSGSTSLTIKAVLKGGTGDCGWQHAQLFRQSTTDIQNYPFHVHITFKNK